MSDKRTLWDLIEQRLSNGEFGRHCDKILEKWGLSRDVPPSREELPHLRFLCPHLLDNPDLIESPWAPILYQVIYVLVDKTKDDWLTPKDIATLVDWRMTNGIKVARRIVAALTGKTVDAVRKNHERHGRKRTRVD